MFKQNSVLISYQYRLQSAAIVKDFLCIFLMFCFSLPNARINASCTGKVDRLRWIVFLLCSKWFLRRDSACWIWHKQTRSRTPNINKQHSDEWRYWLWYYKDIQAQVGYEAMRSRSIAIFPPCLQISIFIDNNKIILVVLFPSNIETDSILIGINHLNITTIDFIKWFYYNANTWATSYKLHGIVGEVCDWYVCLSLAVR